MGLNLNEIKAAQSANSKGFTPNTNNKARRNVVQKAPYQPTETESTPAAESTPQPIAPLQSSTGTI